MAASLHRGRKEWSAVRAVIALGDGKYFQSRTEEITA